MTVLAKSWMLLGIGIAGIFLLGRRQRAAFQKGQGAFIQYLELLPPPPPAPPKAPPPLKGVTFAVKDIFDMEGLITGFGSPDWAQTHGAATQTAPAVELLVKAGAKCIGKTHMDEMAFSINGENKHYGTPVNPAAPDRIPGGSSSGSAVAVAADLVDFAIGTDTGGSVRAPASFCGILGFRPSHGVIPTAGVVPMAQSFDTIGWFARDPIILRQVGHILLQLPYTDVRQPRRILIAEDCFKISVLQQEQHAGPVIKSIQKLLGCHVLQTINLGEHLERNVPCLTSFRAALKISGSCLDVLRDAMSLLQMFEFKSNHEEWINSTRPDFAPDIAARVSASLDTSPELVPLVQKMKDECREAMNELLKNQAILVLPTVPGVAPKLKSKDSDEYRRKAFTLLCIGGMSGCCQVNLPSGEVEDVPLGVSLMAKHGSDRFLLDTVVALHSTVQEEAKISLCVQSASPVANGKHNAAEIAKEKVADLSILNQMLDRFGPQGNAAFKARDYLKAVSHYSEAILLDKKNATYYSNRAAAYLQMCSFPQAEADCTKAITIDKKNVKAMLRRGTAREFLGYYKEADEDFRQALILEPTNKQAIDAVKRLKKLLYE